jgi:hypothetical protein
MTKRLFLFAVLALSASWGAAAPFKHLGPVETLDNGVVTVDVALNVGRITAYQRKGELNWLKVDDSAPTPGWHWNPWGGDRVWPTAQDHCPQIYKNKGFDPVIDGGKWELISRTATMLEMRSGISPHLGLRITRRIELAANSNSVEHTFLIERISPSPFPVHVWTVTGLRAGDYTLMESDSRVEHPGWKPFKWWRDVSEQVPAASLLPNTRILQVAVPKPPLQLKVGTYGRWIAFVSGVSAFRQEVIYDADQYYSETSNLQTFLNAERAILEIETLSPAWTLREGESQRWKVRWQLVDFPAEAETPTQRAALLTGVQFPAAAGATVTVP